MKNFIQAFLLFSVTLFSCNKAEVSPIISNPAYSTILLANELPDNAGGINSTFQDAVILEDGKTLAIIDYKLYTIENNIYTYKMSPVFAIKRTNDGNIYVLGEDAIYISIDNGESFSVQEKFVAKQGQSYALDLYYNGKPNNILVKKIPDGSYIMWLYTKYDYSLGGTGFTELRYLNFVFTSTDGLTWQFQPDAGAKSNSYPSAIDNNGLVYLVERQDENQYVYYTSNDLGVNRETIQFYPNAISNSNKLYNIDRIAISTRFESIFQQWNGQSWQSLNPTLDQKATDINNDQLIVSNVSFTTDNKMLLTNPHGIYISDVSF